MIVLLGRKSRKLSVSFLSRVPFDFNFAGLEKPSENFINSINFHKIFHGRIKHIFDHIQFHFWTYIELN
jgi:hypothetical protein